MSNQTPVLLAFKQRLLFFVKRFPLTSICILASILVSIPIVLKFSAGVNIPYLFEFSYFGLRITASLYKSGLSEIWNGEIHRLITPVFLHFNLLHIIFNMMAMYYLGAVVEFRHKAWFYILIMIMLGVSSNIAQYIVSGPKFGGMSGVIYGLFGYIWMQQKFNPGFGLFLEKQVIIMAVAWFVLCYIGLIGNIANTAHTVGLVLGVICGFSVAMLQTKFNFKMINR